VKNSGQQPWVSPLKKIPSVLVPIVRAQEKHYGQILNPTRWWGRFPFLFWLIAFFVGFLERKKSAISPTMRALVMTRVSQQCECDFCIDANSLRLAQRSGSLDKVMSVYHWQEADCFDDQERAALAYADGMTATPPSIDEALKSELKRYFSEKAITELTALVAFQNLSARFNSALDIPSQGLCVPERDVQSRGKPRV
jgi:alkylhydroperoxidase family enzyme